MNYTNNTNNLEMVIPFPGFVNSPLFVPWGVSIRVELRDEGDSRNLVDKFLKYNKL
jgi:hypothetical protein